MKLKPKSNRPVNKPLGVVLFKGKSPLTGGYVVCIATFNSRNVKTGDMIQTWILNLNDSPVDAVRTGSDSAQCGNCMHRKFLKGSCYINEGQAPQMVWKAYQAGKYEPYVPSFHAYLFSGRYLRMGSYGDPAVIPFEIWQKILPLVMGHTGYTHQINMVGFDQRFLGVCMVSADSYKQALKYQELGVKTFRVAMKGDSTLVGEIQCKAVTDNITCMQCMLCDGTQRNVVIEVHGSLASRFKTKLIPLVNEEQVAFVHAYPNVGSNV